MHFKMAHPNQQTDKILEKEMIFTIIVIDLKFI
jgi:hypothetical protein